MTKGNYKKQQKVAKGSASESGGTGLKLIINALRNTVPVKNLNKDLNQIELELMTEDVVHMCCSFII